MIAVKGSKVEFDGYRINIQTEFTMLCHELMEQGALSQDDLLFSISLAAMPDEMVQASVNDKVLDIMKKHPEFAEIYEALINQ